MANCRIVFAFLLTCIFAFYTNAYPQQQQQQQQQQRRPMWNQQQRFQNATNRNFMAMQRQQASPGYLTVTSIK